MCAHHSVSKLKNATQLFLPPQVLETKKVNVTHLESVRRKKHSLCLKPPFLCAEWINTMETRVKEENITRLVTR